MATHVQGDTKKTAITKNRITSKILFRLTQNVSHIRSSLCSRHLQSFKSVLQKLFVSLALKKCAPDELPGAAGAFGSEMITEPEWTPAGVCILGWSRSQYFRFEQEPESTLRSVQEPIKIFRRPNFCNDACCCQTEWN